MALTPRCRLQRPLEATSASSTNAANANVVREFKVLDLGEREFLGLE